VRRPGRAAPAGDILGVPGGRRGQPHGPGPVPFGDQPGVSQAGRWVVPDQAGLARGGRRGQRKRGAEGARPGGGGRALLHVGGSAGPGDQESGRGELLVGADDGRAGQPERGGQGPGGRQPVAVVDLAAGDDLDQRVRHLAGPVAGPAVQVQREVNRGGRPRHTIPSVIVVPYLVGFAARWRFQYV